MKVSLFASSVRPQLYPEFFTSLEGTSVQYEVIFAGPAYSGELINNGTQNRFIKKVKSTEFPDLEYIPTLNIKPAQCYEIARRQCCGETVIWVADDCEFPNDVVGKAYYYWKSQHNEKLILSIQTKETGYGNIDGSFFNMKNHSFFGFRPETPLMAPLALMSRKFLDDLGGIDRRYVCGQYENDIVMRAYAQGAKVEIFGDKECYIDIDHLRKSIAIGESKNEKDFLNRPFATGYAKDREVLENSWCRERKFLPNFGRYDSFEPYSDEDILTKSQSNKGRWE